MEKTLDLSEHIPKFSEVKESTVKVCHLTEKKQSSVFIWCTAPQWNVYIYFMTEKNCLHELHSTQFHRKCKYM